ncbi:MAG: pyridoxal phosphate-dependent aminotransferase [Symploca sp. SIO2E9]|nr:pyridoxal phosphate-dependent aminotransferase [Symploca sp. SIO2E9]
MKNSEPIDLALGNVRVGPKPNVQTSLIGDSYAPMFGYQALRKAIAVRHETESHNVTLTTGASLGLTALFGTLNRPASVLIPCPYFPAYPNILRTLGITPISYPVTPGVADLEVDDLISRCRPDTRAVLVNWPGNPLGNIVPRSSFERLLEAASLHNLLIVTDEVYTDFTYQGNIADWEAPVDDTPLIRVRSFSKILGIPGERLGYTLASQDRIKSIARSHWNLAMSAPATAQVFAAEMLLSGLEAYIEKLRKLLHENLDIAYELLSSVPGLEVGYPPGGPFIWVQLPHCQTDSRTLAASCLQETGVAVMPGEDFGILNPTSLRVSFGAPKIAVETGCQILSTFLKRFV